MRCPAPVLAAVAVLALAAMPAAAQAPPDEAIRGLLAERIDTGRQSVGMVVGVIGPEGCRVVAHGRMRHGDPRTPGGDTLFEIGSVTKVFTALLLADMARRGEVGLDDPVARHLPAEFAVPQRGGRAITLADLATHTSGLPRMPANFAPARPADPFGDYTADRLQSALAALTLPRDPGALYEYSNLGFGLLGFALASRAGSGYETLVASRITGPLRLDSTRITLTPDLAQRLAGGHDPSLAPVPNWTFASLAGAGALYSDAGDLMRFLAAHMGLEETPLAGAMADMRALRRPIADAGHQIALGWHVLARPGGEIVWHNGMTAGYGAFIGFRLAARTGVVVLSNASADLTDLGFHLLDPAVPLRKVRRVVEVDAGVLEKHVGRYAIAPDFVLTVTREGTRLLVQATGQGRYEVYPESETRFFYRIVDAQITFETDAAGNTTRLILHQHGRDMPGARVP